MHRSPGRARAALVVAASLTVGGCATQGGAPIDRPADATSPTPTSEKTTASRPVAASDDVRVAHGDYVPYDWPDPADDLWSRVRAGFSLSANADRRAVREWTQFYASHQKHLDASLARARPFLWHVEQQIEQRDMPTELALLPIVESGYNASARSYAGASGLWQFMPGTADHMGLSRDWWYDGRNDAMASTRAALDYLTLLNDRYDGDWLLTLAAYNAGPGRVDAAIERARARGRNPSYWNLTLPRETTQYVPKLLAVCRIMRTPAKFGVDWPVLANAPRTRVVALPSQTGLAVAARMLDMPESDLRRLNPGMRRWASDPDEDLRLLVPAAKAAGFRKKLASIDPGKLINRSMHRVRRGDVLSRIALSYGVSVAALRQANHLYSDRIRVGQTLQIPRPGAPGRERTPVEPTRTYVVQAGDTLWDIAHRYHIDVTTLRKRNARVAQTLRPGQTLALPGTAKPPAPATDVVQSGDSLWAIARANGVTVADLRRWNRIGAGGRLVVGQQIAVDGPAPLPDYYDVVSGDSLWSIAHRFSMQVATLRSLNDMGPDSTLQPGQRLRLQPSASG